MSAITWDDSQKERALTKEWWQSCIEAGCCILSSFWRREGEQVVAVQLETCLLAPTLTKAAPAQEVKRNWNHSCCDKSRAVTAMSLLLWGNKLRCPTRIIPLHPIGMSRNIQVMGQYGHWPHISRMPHSPFNIFTCLYQSSWISILLERGLRLLLLFVYSVLKSNFVHYMNINTTSLVAWIKRSQRSQIFWSIFNRQLDIIVCRTKYTSLVVGCPQELKTTPIWLFRDEWHHQNRWIFRKVRNGLWPPPSF